MELLIEKIMSNVLITGASGFIGANLVRNLINTKDQIHILIRKQSNLWRLNNIISECNVVVAIINFAKDLQYFNWLIT